MNSMENYIELCMGCKHSYLTMEGLYCKHPKVSSKSTVFPNRTIPLDNAVAYRLACKGTLKELA